MDMPMTSPMIEKDLHMQSKLLKNQDIIMKYGFIILKEKKQIVTINDDIQDWGGCISHYDKEDSIQT